MRAAVVGHVEWIEFARVERVPAPGEIVHALETWEEPGGGGAVAAVQLAKLAGGATFFTALGDDELGRRAHRELTALGLRVEVAWRDEPQRRAFVYVDAAGERTITVIGSRLGPVGDDPLPWDELAGADAVYFTAGDAAAATGRRAARCLVSTARGIDVLAQARVELDALVASGADAGERYERGRPRSRTAAGGPHGRRRRGCLGGARWRVGPVGGGRRCPARSPTPTAAGTPSPAGSPTDWGAGMGIDDALALGARCGAACFTGKGPYEAQLTAADV